MKKPLIGITGNIFIDAHDELFPGLHRAYANNDYIRAVEKAGGTPLILPLIFDSEAIKDQVEAVDGILLSGGYDVHPRFYGEEPLEKLEFILQERDKHEIQIIKIAIELNKPIFGICRGLQILNVALGGSLYQDLSYIEGCYIKHVQSSLKGATSHSVDIIKGTKLFDILGENIITNSIHHQAVKDAAPTLEITALSKDGIVEGLEYTGDNYIVAVQWHPEMIFENYPIMLKLFERLVEEASKKKE